MIVLGVDWKRYIGKMVVRANAGWYVVENGVEWILGYDVVERTFYGWLVEGMCRFGRQGARIRVEI